MASLSPLAAPDWAPRIEATGVPELATVYGLAVATLDANIVTDEDGRAFIRAGAGYPTPWARDASLNAWGAASILRPEIAGTTLRMVCEDGPEGPVIAQDDQWWDQITWVIAAEQHACATGDQDFLTEAYGIGVRSLRILDASRYDSASGLYRGAVADAGRHRGLPYPAGDRSGAFVVRARLSCRPHHRLSGTPTAALILPRKRAGIGLLAALDVVPAQRAAQVLGELHQEPYGHVNVWPTFERYDQHHPGRHNVMCWPADRPDLVGDLLSATGASRCPRSRPTTERAALHRPPAFRARHGARDRIPVAPALLDLTIEGAGSIVGVRLDGEDVIGQDPHLPADLTGAHTVQIERSVR